MDYDSKKLIDFDKILARVKSLLNTESDKDVASAIGMKPNTFHMRKKNNSVPLIEFVVLADSKNVNMNWLIYGDGPIYKDELQKNKQQKTISESVQKIVIEHLDIVHDFDDHEEALDANKNLVTLEKLDCEEFYAITGRLRGKVKKLLKQRGITDNQNEPEDPKPHVTRKRKAEKKMI